MKRLSGFSLMEMMIVLLIVSIVAAASAPMINKKMVTAASEKSPWVWTGTDNSIAYNLGGDNRTAVIGAVRTSDSSNPKLYIKSTSLTSPQIALQENSDDNSRSPLRILWGNTTLRMSSNNSISSNVTDSVLIGNNTRHTAGNYPSALVAIGSNAVANSYSVAVGNSANTEQSAVALGYFANARGDNSIAIGRASNAGVSSLAIGSIATSGTYSLAVGSGANSDGANSTAIGRGANSSSANSVSIGDYARSLMPRSVAIGQNAYVPSGPSVKARAIAIGYNAYASNSDAIAIGGKYGAYPARAQGIGSIAIGATTLASSDFSIAIGGTSNSTMNVDTGTASTTKATAMNAIAIGTEANAAHTNSVAIGRSASTSASNQIVLGTVNDTVVIPGTLEMDRLVVKELAVKNPRGIYYKTDSSSWGGFQNLWVRVWGVTKTHSSDRWIPGVEKSTPSFVQDSDRRLKNVGKAFVSGLEEIKKIETFHYTFKKDSNKTPRVGIMAQDLQKIFPDAVFKGEDGFLRIRMEDMFYALVNAVKELDAKFEAFRAQDISALRNKIDTLEKENKELKKQNQEFEKRLTKLEKNTK